MRKLLLGVSFLLNVLFCKKNFKKNNKGHIVFATTLETTVDNHTVYDIDVEAFERDMFEEFKDADSSIVA